MYMFIFMQHIVYLIRNWYSIYSNSFTTQANPKIEIIKQKADKKRIYFAVLLFSNEMFNLIYQSGKYPYLIVNLMQPICVSLHSPIILLPW